MYLGKVIGTVVASQKYSGLEGIKFLLVQEQNSQKENIGKPFVACDGTAQAGVGDFVYLVGSREAALAFENNFIPIDAAIVGIVDEVDASSFIGE